MWGFFYSTTGEKSRVLFWGVFVQVYPCLLHVCSFSCLSSGLSPVLARRGHAALRSSAGGMYVLLNGLWCYQSPLQSVQPHQGEQENAVLRYRPLCSLFPCVAEKHLIALKRMISASGRLPDGSPVPVSGVGGAQRSARLQALLPQTDPAGGPVAAWRRGGRGKNHRALPVSTHQIIRE